ncbi:MAG: hypothetical protein A2033_15960 [Bacteroidetes bacterium GWA2_31_9]|nr:MAG: hypothetical protein A2033_15960 [Bacteroidetes bacterium GWA2_31_9]
MANLFDLHVSTSELPQEIKNIRNKYKDYLQIEKGHCPVTIRHKINALRTFIARSGIQHLSQLEELTVKDFFYKQCKDHEWSANTYRNYWKNLKCFFTWAIYNKLVKLESNPLDKLGKPKIHKVVPRRLSKEQLHSVFTACCTFQWRYAVERARNVAILATFIYTGIRINELINIRVEDVSIKQRTILIRKGKGGKVRIVKVPMELVRFLEDFESHIKRINIQREYYFSSIGEYKIMTNKYIYTICKKLADATNIYFRPHMLRHTFASMALEQKIPIASISKIMGHESILYTQSYLAPEENILLSHFESLHFLT